MQLPSFALFLRFGLLFLALCCACIGTGLRQMKSTLLDLFLYGAKRPDGTAGSFAGVIDTKASEVTRYKYMFCFSLRTLFDVSFAFAIIACVAIGFSLLTAIFSRLFETLSREFTNLTTALSFIGMASPLISFALIIAIYHRKQCEYARPFADEGVDLAEGFGLMVGAWVIMIVDFVLAVLIWRAGRAEKDY